MPPLPKAVRERLLEALARVDAFAARVAEACTDELACGPGCSDCCTAGLWLRGVEAAYVLEGLSGAGRARGPAPEGRCPLLSHGRCRAYAHRPALCRTHGLPMLRREEGRASVHCCPLNFRTREARLLSPSLLLDEARLVLLFDAVDALYCRETGWSGERVAMARVAGAGLQD